MSKKPWWPLGILAGFAAAEAAARAFARPWPTLADFPLRPETQCGMPCNDSQLRVLALGDSITYGNGVRYDEAYPAVLQRMQRQARPEGVVSVVNGGGSGMTVLYGLRLLPLLDRRYRPHVVSIGFGANDCNLSRSFLDEKLEREFMAPSWVRLLRQSRLFVGLERRWRRAWTQRAIWLEKQAEPRVSEAAFERALRAMVRAVRGNAAIPVLLTMAPPGPDFRPDASPELRRRLLESNVRYNELIRRVAEGAYTNLIDVDRTLQLEAGDWAADGVHLTVSGYEKLAALVFAALRPVLG